MLDTGRVLTPSEEPAQARGRTVGSCRRRVDWRPSQVAGYEAAIDGSDPVFSLMAHALRYLTANVATFIASYALIDFSPETYVVGPCVIKTDSNDAPDIEELYNTYVAHAGQDPLMHASLSQPTARLICIDDAGGRAAYDRSPFATAFREKLGIGPRVRLLLRMSSEPVAAIGLIRRNGEADFGARDKAFLLASHDFLEAVHLIALRRARADGNLLQFTQTHQLSGREREVVRLILSGASNTSIAEELTITAATVRRDLQRVCNKLGVKTRTQLITKILAPHEREPPHPS
jgi:DNA-binding CsgD family transcriptional regulator